MNRVGRARDRAQAAGDALLEVVLVAHQHLLAAVFGKHRELLVRIVHRDRLLEEMLEGGGKTDDQGTDDSHCPKFTRPLRSM
jgi:hypothetical protein